MHRHIDLCAGLGTMSLALAEHGFKTIMACDKSKHCREVYLANHGEVGWEDDVFDIRELPACEVLTAGAPCQSFSACGKRAGFACPENGGVFARILELIRMAPSRPEVVLFENVMGLKTIEKGRCLRWIEEEVEGLGYAVRTVEVRAQQWGSPATRARIFVVGRRHALFLGELPPFPTPPMIRGRIRDHLEIGEHHEWLPVHRYFIMPKEMWKTSVDGVVFVGYFTGRALQFGRNPEFSSAHGQNGGIYHIDGVNPCITCRFGALYVPNGDGEEGGRVRRLTVHEVSSMMGLPSDFEHHSFKTHAMQMLANTISMYALRPVVAWALGE
jgi:DNA (cytosine-5)-methyltransferase 1